MADALCGPSNALQNFKSYAQVDRTLQQDRLNASNRPVEGFRTHDPRAGSLDAEFHAFENATANPFHEPMVGNSFPARPHFPPPASYDWATDFQNLRVSDHPIPPEQFRAHAPLVKTSNSGWQNEFAAQHYPPQIEMKGKQPFLSQQNTMEHFRTMSSFNPYVQLQQPSESLQRDQSEQVNGGDWSQAFEDAFKDAFNEVEQTEQSQSMTEHQILHQDGIYTNDHSADIQPVEQTRIGSDAIQYTEAKDQSIESNTQDANALARVAGELLHNVQHDSSEKFQNSQFLDLMRKIRDRQVEIKNNDFEPSDESAAGKTNQLFRANAEATDQHILTANDPVQNQDNFAFPDMNMVYSPREADFVDYTFDSDQFPTQPRTQISDLHPGGKFYPGQSPPQANAQMSGAVSELNPSESSKTISAADFESNYDENRDFASRFHRAPA